MRCMLKKNFVIVMHKDTEFINSLCRCKVVKVYYMFMNSYFRDKFLFIY